MSNLWGDDEEVFRDIPEGASTGTSLPQGPMAPPAPYRPSNVPAEPVRSAAPSRSAPAPQPVVEESYEETEDLEEDFSEVLNDASLRLEQGRLYQMIMNHELFDGMDANPKASANVQREIRKFARERMEIMLGMRKETTKIERLEIDFPFNSVEVDVLKALARTASKGASENSDRYVPEVKKIVEEVDNVPVKKATFKPLSGTTGFKPQAKESKPLQAKPKEPIQRKRLDPTIERILAEEGIDRSLLEEDYIPIGKPLDSLTAEELAQRQEQTRARMAKYRTVKSNTATPMATPEQELMLATSRANQMESDPVMSALLAKVKSMTVKS